MGALGRALACAFLCACLPDGKEDVELPASTSNLRGELIGQLSAGMRDVREVRVFGDRLYAADETGLYIFDITDAGAPTLIGSINDGRVDHIAADGTIVYLIEVTGDRLREWDVTDAGNPVQLADVRSLTRTFGGIDARDGLVWHAVGSSPPSRIFYEQPLSLDGSCFADDQERGIMDVWLEPGLVILSVHFDDFGGDGIDGNGGFGFVVFESSGAPGECPDIDKTDLYLAEGHGLNRSTFEEPTNSDLQAAYDAESRHIFFTGEQRVRRFLVNRDGRLIELAELAIPEVLDVEVEALADGLVVGTANGDFALLDGREGTLDFADLVVTPGTARAVASAGSGDTFYVADGEAGVAVVRYAEAP